MGIIRHHHERYDGGGYPDALAGDQIPYGARVLSVADAFDAMVTSRPYREALDLELAIGEIEQGIGTQFDPALAQRFLDGIRSGQITMLEEKRN